MLTNFINAIKEPVTTWLALAWGCICFAAGVSLGFFMFLLNSNVADLQERWKKHEAECKKKDDERKL